MSKGLKYIANILTRMARDVFHLNSAYELNNFQIGIK